MGDVYYQQVDVTLASDATQDIWSLVAGATRKVRLLGWELTSTATTESIIDINLHRVTAVGSGGSASTTEEAADELAGAVTAGVRFEDTTPGTDGGGLMSYQWEQLGPVGHTFTPEMAPVSKVSEGFALTCNTAATPTLSGWICWEEI
jgi:hypothetical protein